MIPSLHACFCPFLSVEDGLGFESLVSNRSQLFPRIPADSDSGPAIGRFHADGRVPSLKVSSYGWPGSEPAAHKLCGAEATKPAEPQRLNSHTSTPTGWGVQGSTS